MAKIFLIRHGESVESGGEMILSKKGILQSKKLAKKLKKLNISKIYVSNLKRALETYNEFHKLKPKIKTIKTSRLNEIYRKLVGGPKLQQVSKNRERNDKKRIESIIKEIIKNLKKEENIVIFTHGNLIRYFIAKILNIKKICLWREMTISNASISLIEIINKKATMVFINNTEHLVKNRRFIRKSSLV